MRKEKGIQYGAYFLLFVSGYSLAIFSQPPSTPLPLTTPSTENIQVCFSPRGNCENQIIEAIRNAKMQILVQAFALTSLPITQELINAYEKGVTVRILYDSIQAQHQASKISLLQSKGIEAVPDKVAGLSHNKVLILDDWGIITGSYNFTQAANVKNAENLLVIKDPHINKLYRDHWLIRYNHALQKIELR